MRYFRILFVGSLVNSVGTGMTAFALAIHLYSLHGNATSVAAAQLAAFAPILLLAPLAGVLADRYDRRAMMMLGDGGSILGLALVLLGLSRGSTALVLGGVALSSCFAALTEPAIRATVSDLVHPDQFVRSSGMLQMAASAKYLISPVAAGLLLRVVPVQAIVLIDMGTAVVTVCCTLLVRRAIGAGASRTEGAFWVQFSQGWRAVLGSRRVVAVVALMSALTLSLGTIQVLIKPVLLPHATASQVGMAETIVSCGMLLGGLLVSFVKGGEPHVLVTMGVLGVGLTLLGAGLSPHLWWMVGCCFCLFGSLSFCNAGADAIVRASIPNHVQGRAWGVIGLVSQVGFLIAYAGAGPIADAVLGPLLQPEGAWASTVGVVVGVGPGRGAALLISVMGVLSLLLVPLTRHSVFTTHLGRPEVQDHDLATTAI